MPEEPAREPEKPVDVPATEQVTVRKRKPTPPRKVPPATAPLSVQKGDIAPARERSPRRAEVPTPPDEIELPLAIRESEREGETTSKRPKNEVPEKGADVPFMTVEITDNNASSFLGPKGRPTVDVFVHAIETYNKSVKPEDRIEYQKRNEYKGSAQRYASYIRGLLERRVSIVDKRTGHNRSVFNAFRNERGRRAAVA